MRILSAVSSHILITRSIRNRITMEENQIRQELQSLLQEQPLDYDKIVALSNELAKLDPNNVRFTVDADLVSRLGNELVARQETALSELIKNAYDADATTWQTIWIN